MGFDCYAMTVIGLRITENDLMTKHINCNCKDNNDPEFNYCPTCGKKNIDSDFIDKFEWKASYDYPLYGTITINNIAYSIIQPIKEEHEKWLYINLYYESKHYESEETMKCSCTLEQLVSLKESMKSDLTEIGLWDDEKFGIYTLINTSY